MSRSPDDKRRRGPENSDRDQEPDRRSSGPDAAPPPSPDDDFDDLPDDGPGQSTRIPSERWVQQYEPWERTQRIWSALLEEHPDRFYVYDDRLHEAIPAEEDKFGLGRLQEVTDRDFAWRIDQARIGKRHSEKDAAKKNERPSREDRSIAMTGAKDCGVPVIRQTWHCPFVAPNDKEGRIVGTRGYDASTETYLFWDGGPVRGDAPFEKAKQVIDSLLDTFAWGSDSDRAHAAGFLLMPFLRPTIQGATPLHVVWSAHSGSGKSHLVKVVGRLLGQQTLTPLSTWGSEGERQLNETLLRNPQLTFFDNIPEDSLSRAEAAAWLSALTAGPEEPYSPRMIGGSVRPVLINCIWAATPRAGRVPIGEEMKRRVIPIELRERKLAKLRKGAPLDFITKKRETLVNFFLSLLQPWLEEGAPGPNLGDNRELLGSFQAWDHLVGGAVEFIWPELKGCWMHADHRPKAVDDEDLATLAHFWIYWLAKQNANESSDADLKWSPWMTAEEIARNCAPGGLGLASLGAHMGMRTVQTTLARLVATERIVEVPGFGRYKFIKRKSSRIVYGFVKV